MLVISFSFVVACGSKSTSDLDNKNKSFDNVEKDDEVEIGISTTKKLNFTLDDVFSLSQFDDLDNQDFRVYNTDDGITVKTMKGKNMYLRFFAYYLDNEEYPVAFFVKSTDSNKKLNFEILDKLYAKYDPEYKELIQVLEDDGENHHTAGFIFNNELKYENLPMDLKDLVTDDFFTSAVNQESFKKLNDEGNFSELFNMANEYKNNNEVGEYDSVHKVIKILEPVVELLDKVDVVVDEVENTTVIYYKGLKNVSSDNYVVPFINTKYRHMEFELGFEKDGWLFATEYIFNIDGEVFEKRNKEFTRDVIGGSKIKESYIDDYDEELVNAIINGEKVVLRFKGEKGNLDYTLTESDINAVKVINEFNDVHHKLSDLAFGIYSSLN